MHRGKGMKFEGDSRISANRKPNIPKDYSEYPGKTEAFWPNFLLKEWMVARIDHEFPSFSHIILFP